MLTQGATSKARIECGTKKVGFRRKRSSCTRKIADGGRASRSTLAPDRAGHGGTGRQRAGPLSPGLLLTTKHRATERCFSSTTRHRMQGRHCQQLRDHASGSWTWWRLRQLRWRFVVVVSVAQGSLSFLQRLSKAHLPTFREARIVRRTCARMIDRQIAMCRHGTADGDPATRPLDADSSMNAAKPIPMAARRCTLDCESLPKQIGWEMMDLAGDLTALAHESTDEVHPGCLRVWSLPGCQRRRETAKATAPFGDAGGLLAWGANQY